MFGTLDEALWRNRLRAKRGKSSQKRRFTLFLVSSHGDSKSLSFGARAPRIAMACIFMAILSLFLFIRSYRAHALELRELRYMRDVAESQRQQITELEEQFSELNSRLQQAEVLGSEIREMLDREGLAPQSFSPAFGPPVSPRALRTTNRAFTTTIRNISPADMGRTLYVLRENADKLAGQTVEVLERTRDLHDKAVQVVAKLRSTPSIWPVRGEITSEFGWRRHPLTYAREFHEGIDIGASSWTPIVSTADGVVSFAGYKYGYGWTVIVTHDYGFETLYAHCVRLEADKGDEVKRGDVIAYVGQSGTATGPHVHYEVRLWGTTIDPSKYLPKDILEVDYNVRQD